MSIVRSAADSLPPTPPSPATAPARPRPNALSVFARRRTYAELSWALLGLVIGIAGFTLAVVTLVLSAGLLITFIGLPLLAASGLWCRRLGAAVRRGANRMIGTDVPPALPIRSRPGFLGWVQSRVRDAGAWRARLYLVLKLPLGILSFSMAVTFWVGGLGSISYPIWQPYLPCNGAAGGVCHRGWQFAPHWYADTAGHNTLVVLGGIVLLLLAPWVVKGVVGLDRLAVRGLLGRTRRGERVAELERSRAQVVDASAASLRRIERDLHDGAQARLVALAMTVGRARDKVASGGDPAEAARLLDAAHADAKHAIAELRDLARGIHPPVLDTGLDAALDTLAAHSTVPVELRTQLSERPAPAIETMVYFCAAELLTNVGKHSGARQATIETRSGHGLLRMTVTDDGRGGALATGSGLRGLRDRVAAVDGRLDIVSPAGGPTTVRVEVPLRTTAAEGDVE